ncbi:protein kinase [Nocardia sp. NPDC051832]|uniref:protein kinase domain-containing protein n=1 Tax=Nocardia sp. NPDC051832 TaxID=3155673 RepID=UPI0034229187
MDGPGWRVGSRFGPYELRALLGKGGMGEVYEAYDTVKERVVAVKLLPEELAKDPVYQVRFRRESQAAARLAEPHIIPIHDWGVIDGVLFIDMRLVPGSDLRSLLRGLGPMQPQRAIAIIEQIAAALDAAHADGLVHRDVKPANILVTEADFAYLADFGIAHTEGDAAVTQVGMAVGSYVYMAPERFDVGQVTGRADIYSLACVLHECLTGATPFPQASMSVLIRSHLTEAPPRPSVARPGVPPALDDVIARGMAKDPADRYPTAAAFAQAARAALGAPAAPAPKFVVHAPDPSRFGNPDATATRNAVVPPEATGEFSVIQPPAASEVSLTDFHFTPLPQDTPDSSGPLPIRPFPDAHLYEEIEQFPSGQFAAVKPEAPVTQKYKAPYGSEPQPYTPPESYHAPERFAEPQSYPESQGYDEPDNRSGQQDPSRQQAYSGSEGHSEPRGFAERAYAETEGRSQARGFAEQPYAETENFSEPRGFATERNQGFNSHPESRGFDEPQAYSEPQSYSEPRGSAEQRPYPEPQGYSESRDFEETRTYSQPEGYREPQAYSEAAYPTVRGRNGDQDLTPAARAYPVEPYDEQFPDEQYAPETRRYPEYAEPDPYQEPQRHPEDPYRPAAQAYSEYRPPAAAAAPDYDDDRYSPRGGYDYAEEPEDPYQRPSARGSIVLPILVGVISVVVVAVVGAVGWQMFGAGNSQPVAETAAEGSSVAATPRPVTPGTPAPQSSSASPTTTSGTAVKLPDGAKACSTGSSTSTFGRAATGSEVTSCQFAEAVRKAYAESASATRAPSSVVATSPVTGRTYTMNCVAQGQLVTCSGGENAVVYVY